MKRTPLKNKRILFGLTGSVAAYKAVEIIRRLRDEGASVVPVMTEASKQFLTPLLIEAASGAKAHWGLFDEPMSHVSLAAESDLLLVAPATANSIGKFACGIADDLLSTIFLSFRKKVVIAPAMNWRMYEGPALRRNLDFLRSNGAVEVPPVEGPLACGEEGRGRMAEAETIVEAVKAALTEKDLSGRRLIVTAGPTREYLDAVRFISNPSTGKMGYALARVALRRGAAVTLISGPSALKPPEGAKFIAVESASGMREAVMDALHEASALIMAAAVTDFAPKTIAKGKLDKSEVSALRLNKTPDILAEAGAVKRRKPLLVGFAAESGMNLKRAKEKLKMKGADMIVLNDISAPGSGFGVDTNAIVIVEKGGSVEYPLMDKEDASGAVLDRVVALLGQRKAVLPRR